MSTEVTTVDTETGHTETILIQDDYVLIVAGTCYLDTVEASDTTGSGTHTLVVRGRKAPELAIRPEVAAAIRGAIRDVPGTTPGRRQELLAELDRAEQ